MAALASRYQREVGELTRQLRTLPPGERSIVRAHANVKESCANEIVRKLRTHGVIA